MKAKKIIIISITVITIGMVVMSGVMKLIGAPQSAKGLEDVGVGDFRIWLGLAEVIFAGLFAYDKTSRIGFILLASYFAGALATELSHHMTLNSLVPLSLIWIAAFLRDKSIFMRTE